MKTSRIVIIHLLFWLVVVVVPFLSFRPDTFHRGPDLGMIVQQNIINLIIFYLTYWLFIPFMMKRKKTVYLVLLALAWMVVLAAIRMGVIYYYREYITPLEGRPWILQRHVFRDLFSTMMFTIYPVLIYFSIEWFKERQYRFELVREKQKSEIDLLKSQMNPHFLMNTLNNLYSLVYKGSDRASEAVLKLSDIMRYMLYETKTDLVPLKKEVKFLEAFIELQMLRLANHDMMDFSVEGETEGRMIAPMIFIPFVENAFKHGKKLARGKGITIRLHIMDDRIVFKVLNFKPAQETEKDDVKGIGLVNVRKRLDLQYPEKHTLDIEDRKEYFKIHLEILDR